PTRHEFFYSSRRRHTSSKRDWSSDVCSSDLKRRTLATIAKEKGLEPFAEWLMTFPEEDLAKEAEKYIHPEEELETVEDVYSGVHEILAEYTSDNAEFRKWIRAKTMNSGKIEVTVKDEEADEKGVYQMYYEYNSPVNKLSSH